MKKNHLIISRSLPCGPLLSLLLASHAGAALLVYEGFTGYTGTLNETAPNANTIGLNQGIAYAGSAGTGPGNFSVVGGLTFGSLPTSGGAVSFNGTPASSVSGAQLATSYSGTLYTSYLINLSGRDTTTSGAGFELRLANDDASAGARFRTFSDSRSGTSVVPGVDYQGTDLSGISNSSAGTQLGLGTTYLVVGSFTRVGSGLTVGAPGIGSMYVFTSSQFEHMMSQADPTAYFNSLDASDVGTNQDQIHAFATETVTSSTYNMSSGNRMQFVNVKDAGIIDEIRFADSFLSVIPEPGSVLLAGIGAMALIGRRKR